MSKNTQQNSTTSNQDDQSPDYQESHPDQDLEPPMDDLLDFINSQNHSDDQLDQVLQSNCITSALFVHNHRFLNY